MGLDDPEGLFQDLGYLGGFVPSLLAKRGKTNRAEAREGFYFIEKWKNSVKFHLSWRFEEL